MSDGPDYKPTKQIPAVNVPQNTLDAVLTEVRAMRTETNDRLDGLEKTVGTLVNDKMTTAQRLNILDTRLNDMDARASNNSVRVKAESATNLEQSAELVKERAAREALASEVSDVKTMLLANTTDTIAIRREIVDGVKSFWKKNPKLETALVGLILTALTLATAWVAGRMH